MLMFRKIFTSFLLIIMCGMIGFFLWSNKGGKEQRAEDAARNQDPNAIPDRKRVEVADHEASDSIPVNTTAERKKESPKFCETCGVVHATDSSTNNKLTPNPVHPKVAEWLTHEEKNLTRETLADGTELVHINSGFGHMSTISENSDGTHSVQCVNSVEGITATTAPLESPQPIK